MRPPRFVGAPRFVALGDSLTEGVGDPVGDGWRGWAALLADGLSEGPGRFTNLAVSGAQTRDVLERQLPAALELRPGLVSVVVGVNDTLRCTFDIQAVAARLDRVYGAFTGQGAVLLTACLPDPGTMLGLPGALAHPLARRQRAVNAVVHALSERYEALHLHACEGDWTTDRAMWSADRLHPGERGHRQLALRFHALLTEHGLATGGALARARHSRPDEVGEPVVAGHGRHRLGGAPLHRPAAPAPDTGRRRATAPRPGDQRPARPAGLRGGVGRTGRAVGGGAAGRRLTRYSSATPHGHEAHRRARDRLGGGRKVGGSDHRDHRVAPGGGMVGQEHHRSAVGRDLDRAQHHALTGEFTVPGPLQGGALRAQPDPVRRRRTPGRRVRRRRVRPPA